MRPHYTISKEIGFSGRGKHSVFPPLVVNQFYKRRYPIISGGDWQSWGHGRVITKKESLLNMLYDIEYSIRYQFNELLCKAVYIHIQKLEKPPNIPIEWIEQIGGQRNFNPYSDLFHGCTSFHIKGKGIYVSDDCLLGWVCRKIYD